MSMPGPMNPNGSMILLDDGRSVSVYVSEDGAHFGFIFERPPVTEEEKQKGEPVQTRITLSKEAAFATRQLIREVYLERALPED